MNSTVRTFNLVARLTAWWVLVGLLAAACSLSATTVSHDGGPASIPPGASDLSAGGSGSANAGAGGSGANNADGQSSNPTLATPSTLPPSELPLTVEAVVAFLAGCATTAESVGPCQCATSRLEGGFTMGDLEVFEDRMTGLLRYSPQVAGALVDCRSQTVPEQWSPAAVERYVAACSKGSDALTELCACSVARAQAVVPERHLDAFIASADVRPGFVELISRCL